MRYKVAAGLFIFLLLTSCTTIRKSDLFTEGKLLHKNVSLQPGAAAWSPDSTRLAFIKDKELLIIDTSSGATRTIPGIRPVFIDWAPGNNLLAVNKTGDISELAEINPDDSSIRTVSSPGPLIAAKWLYPPDSFILLASTISQYSIGTFVTFEFTRADHEGIEVFSRVESYLPTVEKDFDAISGWTYAGIRPVYETVLAPEFHKPPGMGSFTYFKTADPIIAEKTRLMKFNDNRFTIPSSWSPDGSRLAVTNAAGLLIIIDTDESWEIPPVNTDIGGRYPAWNPRGSQIYLGGWLLRSDGAALGKIVSGAFESMGVWSPDGTRLAVINGTDLLYFDGFSPVSGSTNTAVGESQDNIRDKMRQLKKLLKDGLVSDAEFKERRKKLFSK